MGGIFIQAGKRVRLGERMKGRWVCSVRFRWRIVGKIKRTWCSVRVARHDGSILLGDAIKNTGSKEKMEEPGKFLIRRFEGKQRGVRNNHQNTFWSSGYGRGLDEAGHDLVVGKIEKKCRLKCFDSSLQQPVTCAPEKTRGHATGGGRHQPVFHHSQTRHRRD